jgi:LysR family cys regulon transcriptional activator
MNLHQIEAVCAVARQGFSISRAAEALGKSQSGLSRQLQLLEQEFGTIIFHRTRNKIAGLTPAGEKILRAMQRVTDDLKIVLQIGTEESETLTSEIRIATTHVYALYVLPVTVKAFSTRFPQVALTLQQTDLTQCKDLIKRGDADIGLITASVSDFMSDTIVNLPAYKLPRCVIVPVGHPLLKSKKITLELLARHPIIAYPVASTNRAVVADQFISAGLHPRIVCSATDSDVCKAYARIGMGIAIMAKATFDKTRDKGLVALNADHLFPPAVLNVVLKKDGYLNRSLRTFISILAPHIDDSMLERAVNGGKLDWNSLLKAAPIYDQCPITLPD